MGTATCADPGCSRSARRQVREHGTGAALFGYTKLYGQVPGGQAELLRVPHADYGPIVVPEGPSDDRFLLLSDVLPTAWQAVQYAATPLDGSLVVLGLGPIGDMSCRVARQLGVAQVIGIDRVPERLKRARARGIEVFDLDDFGRVEDLVEAIRHVTGGRGPNSMIDAVGMEAGDAHPVLHVAATSSMNLLWCRGHQRASEVGRSSIDQPTIR